MITDGLIIAIVGMGVVFTFLVLLVVCMNLMAKVINFVNKLCPEVQAEPVKVHRSNDDDDAVAVAIAMVKMN